VRKTTLEQPTNPGASRLSAALADRVIRDLRYASRGLLRNPGFSLVVLSILGLGIGANTAIFSIVNTALFSPALPYGKPDQIVRIYMTQPRTTRTEWLSHPEFVDLRNQEALFSCAAAASDGEVWSLQKEGATVTVLGEVWSPSLFSLIEVAPSMGRALRAEDDLPGAEPVVMLSDATWRTQHAADPGIIGKRVRINGLPVTVVGVGPRGFKGTLVAFSTDYWIPWATAAVVDPERARFENRRDRGVRMFARLQPGITPGQAQARLDIIAARLAEAHPDTNHERKFRVFRAADVRLDPMFDKAMGPLSVFLLAVVGLALLVACSNLAGMLLSRALSRQREAAVRMALGAGKGRLLGELLTESALLGLVGGGLGVLVALLGLGQFTSLNLPVPVTLTVNAEIDARVLAFAFLLSIATSVLVGLVPALRVVRGDLTGIMRDNVVLSRRYRGLSLQNALVVVQVAASVVLLITAGLFLRTIGAIQSTEIPFESKRIAFATVDVARGGVQTETDGRAFLDRYRERVASLRGIQSAALARQVPLSLWGTDRTPIRREDQRRDPDVQPAGSFFNVVSPEYFSVMGIRILRGRSFNKQDGPASPHVVVISEAMAARLFENRNAIGAYCRVGPPGEEAVAQVVGIARDMPIVALREKANPYFYVPFAQKYSSNMSIIVRTVDPIGARDLLRRELQTMNAQIPMLESRTMDEQVAGQTYIWRVVGIFLSVFGSVTMLLACIGLYGLVSFAVARRTREIGIRIALGAVPAQVVVGVLRRSLMLTLSGATIGLVLAGLTSQALRRLLQDVSPTDPAVYASVVLLLSMASFLAAFLPARRAARLDPMSSLRHE